MLPDDALVVRGGRNRPEDIERGFGVHPSGAAGVSVESAPGLSAAELAEGVPHGRVGVTTVGRVRAGGGDVVRTSGRSPNHATLVGLSPETASALLTPTVATPPGPRSDAVTPLVVYADFNNADPEGRVRLNGTGTLRDLARLGARLRDGLPLIVHDEELAADGEAVFSPAEGVWAARIDWSLVRTWDAEPVAAVSPDAAGEPPPPE